MLAALRQAAEDYESDPARTVRQVYRWDGTLSAAADRRIEAAWNRTLPEMQFIETPLAAVIRWLAQTTGAPIYISPMPGGLQMNNPPAEPVSLTFDGERLRDVLPGLLSRHGLAYRVRHDVIYIDAKRFGDEQVVRIYPLADLIDPQAAEAELFWRYRGTVPPGIELLETTGENLETWDEVDEYHYLDSVDCLLVRATPAAHNDLQKAFSRLRSARGKLDFAKHAKELAAARQGMVSLRYQSNVDVFDNKAIVDGDMFTKLRGRMPAEIRDRVRFRIDDEGFWIEAAPADHRRVREAIEKQGLPLWWDEPPSRQQQQGFGIVPVVGYLCTSTEGTSQ